MSHSAHNLEDSADVRIAELEAENERLRAELAETKAELEKALERIRREVTA